MRDYLCSRSCGLAVMTRIGSALDRAPRPYTASELAEVSGIPQMQVMAFLRHNTVCGKVSSRRIPRTGGGKPLMEYWRGQGDVMETFWTDDTMDEKMENRLREGQRPVSWRDGNRTAWCIDETDTVCTMRGGSVVRLGKLESVSFAKGGVTIRVKDSISMTFKRDRQ